MGDYLRSSWAPAAYAGLQSMLLAKFGIEAGIHSNMINPHLADALAYYVCDMYVDDYIPVMFADNVQMQAAFNQYLFAVAADYAMSKSLHPKAGLNNALAVYAEPAILGFISPAEDL